MPRIAITFCILIFSFGNLSFSLASEQREDVVPLSNASTKTMSKSVNTPEDKTAGSPSVSFISGPEQKTHKALRVLKPGENLVNLLKNAPGVVLIDFYADWCGPCRTQGRILHGLEKMATKHRASMIKINIDLHPGLARRLNVSSLPTLLLVKDGKLVERRIGLADRQSVSRLLAR